MGRQWKTITTLDGKEFKLPLGIQDILLLLLAFSFAVTGLDVGIAHYQNKFAPIYEWIPLIFSPLAAVVTALLVWKKTEQGFARLFRLIMVAGIVMGFVGAIFHLFGNVSLNVEQPSKWLFLGIPVAAPLAFSGMALLGLGLLQEDIRTLVRLVALGFLVTALTAFLDHRATNFESPYTLIPIVGGLFSWAVLWCFGGKIGQNMANTVDSDARKSMVLLVYVVMVMMMAVGLLGFILHVNANVEPTVRLSWVMMFYNTPVLAPMGLAQLGALGILVTMREKSSIPA